jgi:ATPases involved in chromosome partitioning
MCIIKHNYRKGDKLMEECTHDCSSCSSGCSDKEPESLRKEPHPMSNIKKVYAIMSGKGGVGKSMVTSQLAVMLSRRGKKVAILDADITGPSIPKMFGVSEKATSSELGLHTVESEGGVSLMSINLLLSNETEPVIWRGPVIAGVVSQFWTDVVWGDIDYMFVDMPPGTGDVPLTIFQALPIDGVIIVTSPQELVSMVVEKAVNMAEMMNLPIVGLVENMSWYECPECGKKLHIFGEGKTEEAAKRHGLRLLGSVPIDPKLAQNCDAGKIESFTGEWLEPLVDLIEN